MRLTSADDATAISAGPGSSLVRLKVALISAENRPFQYRVPVKTRKGGTSFRGSPVARLRPRIAAKLPKTFQPVEEKGLGLEFEPVEAAALDVPVGVGRRVELVALDHVVDPVAERIEAEKVAAAEELEPAVQVEAALRLQVRAGR